MRLNTIFSKNMPGKKLSVVTAALLGVVACSKEEEGITGIDKFKETVTGKWQVVYQGQFNSTDSTRDTLAGTPADFMEFRNTDTVYSQTILPIPAKSLYSILNVRRFLVNGDTLYNRSETDRTLQFYTRAPLTDTSYTEWWVELKKAE